MLEINIVTRHQVAINFRKEYVSVSSLKLGQMVYCYLALIIPGIMMMYYRTGPPLMNL